MLLYVNDDALIVGQTYPYLVGCFVSPKKDCDYNIGNGRRAYVCRWRVLCLCGCIGHTDWLSPFCGFVLDSEFFHW